MGKSPSERELLEIQIKTYEFYAGLIDRAVSGVSSVTMPKWDIQRAYEYKQLADDLRKRLAALDAEQPSSDQVATSSGGEAAMAASAEPTPVAEQR